MLTTQEKSRIRETKQLLTDVDSSTNTKKNPASKAKFAQKKQKKNINFTPFMTKSFQI